MGVCVWFDDSTVSPVARSEYFIDEILKRAVKVSGNK
jgi:hypothetical protein